MIASLLGSVNLEWLGGFAPETLLFFKIGTDRLFLRHNKHGWNHLWNGQRYCRVKPDIYEPKLWCLEPWPIETDELYMPEFDKTPERAGCFYVEFPDGNRKHFEWVNAAE